MSIIKNAKKTIDKQEAVDRITRHIVKEVFKLIDSQKDNLGVDGVQAVIYGVLASFTTTVAYSSLAYQPSETTSDKEKYNITSSNFLNCKIAVQEAIAAAFSGAMHDFTGKEIEYFCNISVVQETKSKKVH